MRQNISFSVGGIIDSDGKQYRFCAEQTPYSFTGYTKIEKSIISFGSFDTTLDLHCPVATTGGGSIVLPRRVYQANGKWLKLDELFGGVFPLRTAARLDYEISSVDDACYIESGDEFIDGYYHIGTEAVYIHYDEGEDVYYLTRGVGGTIAQPHYANQELSQFPVVSAFPYAWNSRPITIFIDRAVWRRGYLTGVPVIGNDTVTLSWVPLEARVSDTPPNALTSPTSRLHSNHYVSVPLRIPQVVIVNTVTAMGQYDTSTKIYSIYNDTWDPTYYQNFDNLIMLPAATYEPDYNIEGTRGSLTGFKVFDYDNPSSFGFIKSGNKQNSTTYYLDCYGLTGRTGTINLAVAGGGRFFITSAVGEVGNTITADSITTVLNNYNANRPVGARHTSWAYDPVASLTYSAPTWFISSRAGDYQTIPMSDYRDPSDGLYQSLYWGLIWSETNNEYWPDEDGDSLYDAIHEAENFHFFKVDGCDISYAFGDIRTGLKDEYQNWRERTRDGYWNSSAPFISRYPLRCATGSVDITAGQGNIKSHATFSPWSFPSPAFGETTVNILQAERWWELGERYLCLASNLGGGTFTAQCTWREPHAEEAFECELVLTYVDYNSNYGYRYEVRPVYSGLVPPGIGDWNGYHAVIKRAPITPYQSDWENILNLLEAVDGRGGTYGSISAGLAIPEEWINVSSFQQQNCTSLGVSSCRMNITEASVTEAITPYLLMSCTAIAGKFTGSNYQIFRIPLTPPCADDVVLHIADDLLVGEPTSSIEYNIATNYKIMTHQPGHTGAAPRDVDFVATDVDACQIFGQGLMLELDLRDAVFEWSADIEEILKSSLARMVDTYGKPQRLWQLTVPFDVGYKLNVGDVISLSSDWVYGKTIGRGVEDEMARIIAVTQDYMGGTTTIQALVAWKDSAGYAPSVQYYSSSNFSSMTVPAHVQTDPTGALHDVDYFRVGATIRTVVSIGTQETYTITGITKGGAQDAITFTPSCTYLNRPLVFEQVTTYADLPKTTHQFILGTSYMI